MHADRLFFASDLTDRSSGRFKLAAQRAAFSPGNFFADHLDRTVIY
jgi:hypothetical protein